MGLPARSFILLNGRSIGPAYVQIVTASAFVVYGFKQPKQIGAGAGADPRFVHDGHALSAAGTPPVRCVRPADQELPTSLRSTVTARRFCDQQEILLHTATGRSLP